jgi:hypothetical protein
MLQLLIIPKQVLLLFILFAFLSFLVFISKNLITVEAVSSLKSEIEVRFAVRQDFRKVIVLLRIYHF